MIGRLPIRLRLTLAFATAMALVLAGTGLFLYARLQSNLDKTIDAGLRSRADAVAALVRKSGSGLRDSGGPTLAARGESFAQVLDLGGRVVDTTPQLGKVPLLSEAEVARAAQRPIFVNRQPAPSDDAERRLLAAPVDARRRRLVVVIGTRLEARGDALEGLLTQLLVGGPIALALASLLGYVLARAALRPVESMRREAEAISAVEPGRRLPVPDTEDEVGRLGTTLNAMLGRLEAAVARERGFVADASHELRTPLALLKAELDLALKEGRTPEELVHAIRSAADETDRLTRLAEDLLVLARADQGRLPVRPERIRMLAIARDAAERLGEVDVEVPAGLELTADPARIAEALEILLDNARRHGAGPAEIRARTSGDSVELHVLDRGPGFPPGFLAHAFDRFSRSDEARSSEGSGLGLAIGRAIARAHGGDAHAANRPGGGADVWITLPLVPLSSSAHAAAVASSAVEARRSR